MAKHKCNCPPPGAPMWLGTFADLMSLLMCFFVLLLAFAEMDVVKFHTIAGSMKYAFGIQRQIKIEDIPKGVSVIALEFKPGKPEPSPVDVITQLTEEKPESSTSEDPTQDETSGGVQKQPGKETGGESSASGQETEAESEAESQAEASASAQAPSKEEQAQQAAEQVSAQTKKIAEKLRKQIHDGAMELESLGQQITIRIKEQGAFSSGSGFLQPRFRPVIRQIGELLKDVPGIITVTGYTDDMRVSNELYSSNWDLSSTRAVAVAQELIKVDGFTPERMKVVGMAYNNPLVPNNSATNRAKNRRVEISIMQGKAKESERISIQP